MDMDDSGKLKAYDQVTPEEEHEGMLMPVFDDGNMVYDFSLQEVRETLESSF